MNTTQTLHTVGTPPKALPIEERNTVSQPTARQPDFLVVRDVAKEFTSKHKSVRAVDDVSFSLARGEFTSIVGPSGCGKSTVLRMVAGLTQASSGTVILDGKQIDGPRREIGIMFQSPVLLPWRTVLHNVLLPAEVQKLEGDYRQDAMDLLKVAGLAGFENHYPAELSGGMQQRVAMCRTLLRRPALLLLDEPFGALDSITREVLNDELLRLAKLRNMTVLLITHSIDEAIYLSDRVILMSSRPGRVSADWRIDLPAERNVETRELPAFGRHASEIRESLGIAHRGSSV
jgi:NitT/TauT family transport system ATP-binding protein